jgi:hypothetical protein
VRSFPKMENQSAEKERHKQMHGHKHGHAKGEGSQAGSHDSQGTHEGEKYYKKPKKKHQGSSQGIPSQDIDSIVDGVSVDLDAPQRYVPTLEKKGRGRRERHHRKNENKAAWKTLGSPRVGFERDEYDEVKEKMVNAETPKNKRKLDEKGSPEKFEILHVSQDPEAWNIMASETLQPTSRNHKKKRKLYDSTRSTPMKLNSIPLYGAESQVPTIIKPGPYAEVKVNMAGTTATSASKNNKKRECFQESSHDLRTVPVHKSPTPPNHVHSDQHNNNSDETFERDRKGEAKISKELVSKSFFVPSSLLTQLSRPEAISCKLRCRAVFHLA